MLSEDGKRVVCYPDDVFLGLAYIGDPEKYPLTANHYPAEIDSRGRTMIDINLSSLLQGGLEVMVEGKSNFFEISPSRTSA